jgi:CubicO group peptidase (beta-lactamase class C family)
MKVFKGLAKDGSVITEDARHPMTIRELMTHTAGFTYGAFSDTPVDKMYRKVNVLDPNSTLKDMVTKLSKIPLLYQPGSNWVYSVSVDIQGYLVEVLSGKPFNIFLKERIFDPLKMYDTDFYVPSEKSSRVAQLYGYDDKGKIISQPGPGFDNVSSKPYKFFSGGAGLVSSPMDYMRFCQMLLNGGELDGVRILSPLTVDLMHRNQLPKELGEMHPGSGKGFGLDFQVVIDPVEAECYSKGEFSWSGYFGTWFWIDPVEDLVFIAMYQQLGERRPELSSLTRRLTYQAIVKP